MLELVRVGLGVSLASSGEAAVLDMSVLVHCVLLEGVLKIGVRE